jgi:type IV secretion system protein VirB9
MSYHRLPILASLLVPAVLFGQGATHPPQQLTPPPLVPSHGDYVAALAALQGKKAPAVATKNVPSQGADSSTPPMITGTITAPAVPTIAEKSLPLTSQQAEALRIAHVAQSESKPSTGEHGRVLYTFGEGIPTVITAPEQLSEIDLEPGEQLQLDTQGLPMLDLGDWHHWTVTPRLVGTGEHAQAFLIVKPEFSGQETTLTVPTDKRIYYIRLLSEPHDYLPQVAFRYPEEDRHGKLQSFAAAQTAQHKPSKETEESKHLKALDTMRAAKSTAYDVVLNKAAKKHGMYLRPAKVYDDGVHIFVQLSDGARYRDLPVLRLSSFTGPDAPNWHFSDKDLTYTIDSLTDRIELLSGTGRHQLRVTITNKNVLTETKPASRAAMAESTNEKGGPGPF